jgi:DNA repair photolyase
MAMRPENVTFLTSRGVLTPASGFLFAFTHTLNPYMGCAFGDGGCGVYCYVAESPLGLYAGQPWGQWLRAKSNAAEALERQLDQMPSTRSLRVFMSSATDPYQPVESRLGIARSILEVFRRRPPELLVVQTRSPLVERDFDLLREMPSAWLSMTVETDDDDVRRALTPTCPSIASRLRAMRIARASGIRVQAAISPTLPHDPARFVDVLGEAADRVIVDTFFGDGAQGKRTAHRPLPRRFAELGYGSWRDQSGAEELYSRLVERLGRDKVGWSQEGFNALAARGAATTALARAQ